jgi:hypothetical protein
MKSKYKVWVEVTQKLQEIPYNIGESWLNKELEKYLGISAGKIVGKPHERMSAYMILSGIKYPGKDNLYNCVKTIIESYLNTSDHNQPRE